MNLLRVETFYLYNLTKAVVICGNNNLVFIVFLIIKLSLKGFKISYKLLILSFILYLGRNNFLREKNHQISVFNFGELEKI